MVNTPLPDASLVKEYVAGNEDALAKLIKRHESKIYGFIYSKIPDRDITNDIFQDTFIKVIKTRNQDQITKSRRQKFKMTASS